MDYFDFVASDTFKAMRWTFVALLLTLALYLFFVNVELAVLTFCTSLYFASTDSRDFVYMVAVSSWALLFVFIGCFGGKDTMLLIASIVSVLSSGALLLFVLQDHLHQKSQSKSQ